MERLELLQRLVAFLLACTDHPGVPEEMAEEAQELLDMVVAEVDEEE